MMAAIRVSGGARWLRLASTGVATTRATTVGVVAGWSRGAVGTGQRWAVPASLAACARIADHGMMARFLRTSTAALSRGMVVDNDGTKLGEMSVEEARKLAHQRNLELRLVHKAPRHSNKPALDVYRLVDANRERKKQEQRERQQARQRRERARQEKELAKLTKEVQLSAWCGEHDLQVKVKQAHKFLSKGLRVRIVIKHRRGQKLDRDQQQQVIHQVQEQLADVGIPHDARQQGAFMVSMIDPRPPSDDDDGEVDDRGSGSSQ
ncbi:hypothetical protein PTSG_00381 [Salpingoeca rosetta]|uniref:Translation initiation factor IF-3 n=1 Tax=Salpingoeca rosetta (strain ATCC 50818 / BSB-021) TaxID=946362 RepID=F2TWB5_SALR5|nr:uncharacterized protein PTSG_00381 [Salpingoeca rosetta]EGD72361.1 hypothetical protein PTSG_00381 [Salpingoeca rosetta]|eukprot:XP_004998930.1 hypothetical protein PTSG_00381 [Salpingoeca rosetta]